MEPLLKSQGHLSEKDLDTSTQVYDNKSGLSITLTGKQASTTGVLLEVLSMDSLEVKLLVVAYH